MKIQVRFKIWLIIASTLVSVSLFGAKEYTGVVTPIVDEQQSVTGGFGIRGWVDSSAHVGQIVSPTIFSDKNNDAVSGSVLIHGDSRDFIAEVNADRYMVDADKKLLYISNDLLKRTKPLAKTGAASQMDLISAEMGVEAAKAQYGSDQENLLMNEIAAQGNIIYATFEGVVTNVTQLPGSDQGGSIVLEVLQLNPIGVQINGITQEDISKITPSTPIKVYVNGVKDPISVMHGYSVLLNGTLTELVNNYPVLNGNTILKPNGLAVLREWGNVVSFDYNHPLSKNNLAIPLTSIQKDSKGEFVWLAKGQNAMDPNKGIEYSFPIEKVYVNTGDLQRPYCGQYDIVNLEDAGSLSLNDLVLLNPPAGLKDGETVICPNQSYLLMPGDNVKVVIGEGPINNRINKN